MSSSWAASALSWWQEAGVDTFVAETPRDWLNPARPAPAAAAAPAAPAPAQLPATLEAFQRWLMSSEAAPFLPLSSARRIPPAGDPAAGLMVLVDMPSAEDVAAGKLLAGAVGELFDRMMVAIARGRDSLYLASLAPFRTATGSLDAAASTALAGIARHHVGLARPKALLLFGDICSKALLGDGVFASRGRWHELATPAGPVRTLATIRPENLLKQPGQKKHAWQDLQMLREGLES
jgi:DNA polymerase